MDALKVKAHKIEAQQLTPATIDYYYGELSEFLTDKLGFTFVYDKRQKHLTCTNAERKDMVAELKTLGYGILKPKFYTVMESANTAMIYKGRRVPILLSSIGITNNTRLYILGMSFPRWDEILKNFPLSKLHSVTLYPYPGFSVIRGTRSNKDKSLLPLDRLGFKLILEDERAGKYTYYSKVNNLTLVLYDRSAGYDDFILADTPDYRQLM